LCQLLQKNEKNSELHVFGINCLALMCLGASDIDKKIMIDNGYIDISLKMLSKYLDYMHVQIPVSKIIHFLIKSSQSEYVKTLVREKNGILILLNAATKSTSALPLSFIAGTLNLLCYASNSTSLKVGVFGGLEMFISKMKQNDDNVKVTASLVTCLIGILYDHPGLKTRFFNAGGTVYMINLFKKYMNNTNDGDILLLLTRIVKLLNFLTYQENADLNKSQLIEFKFVIDVITCYKTRSLINNLEFSKYFVQLLLNVVQNMKDYFLDNDIIVLIKEIRTKYFDNIQVNSSTYLLLIALEDPVTAFIKNN